MSPPGLTGGDTPFSIPLPPSPPDPHDQTNPPPHLSLDEQPDDDTSSSCPSTSPEPNDSTSSPTMSNHTSVAKSPAPSVTEDATPKYPLTLVSEGDTTHSDLQNINHGPEYIPLPPSPPPSESPTPTTDESSADPDATPRSSSVPLPPTTETHRASLPSQFSFGKDPTIPHFSIFPSTIYQDLTNGFKSLYIGESATMEETAFNDRIFKSFLPFPILSKLYRELDSSSSDQLSRSPTEYKRHEHEEKVLSHLQSIGDKWMQNEPMLKQLVSGLRKLDEEIRRSADTTITKRRVIVFLSIWSGGLQTFRLASTPKAHSMLQQANSVDYMDLLQELRKYRNVIEDPKFEREWLRGFDHPFDTGIQLVNCDKAEEDEVELEVEDTEVDEVGVSTAKSTKSKSKKKKKKKKGKKNQSNQIEETAQLKEKGEDENESDKGESSGESSIPVANTSSPPSSIEETQEDNEITPRAAAHFSLPIVAENTTPGLDEPSHTPSLAVNEAIEAVPAVEEVLRTPKNSSPPLIVNVVQNEDLSPPLPTVTSGLGLFTGEKDENVEKEQEKGENVVRQNHKRVVTRDCGPNPLTRPWTLYFSDTSKEAQFLRAATLNLRSDGKSNRITIPHYLGNFKTLFHANCLEDLFGEWKWWRRRFANNIGRPIEPVGEALDLRLAGMGIHLMKEENSFHFFQKGVLPMWEDPMCAKGGKLMFAGRPSETEAIDRLFLEIILLLVSGEIEEKCPVSGDIDTCVVGITIVRRPANTRIEVWLGGLTAPSIDWIKRVEDFMKKEFPTWKLYPYKSFMSRVEIDQQRAVRN